MGRAIWGLVLALAGTSGLTGLVYITNCDAAGCVRATFALGLAGAALVSALFQILAVVGLWLLWTARSRDR
jgi:hypothetical protein